MTATLLNGKAIAREIESEIAASVALFIENNGFAPTLAAVLVGDDPASQIYVRNKERACERVGIESRRHRLAAETTEEELLGLVGKLNSDDSVHGILVQLPLPAHIRPTRILDAVHPLKDVDAFHPDNVGRISQGRPRFLPCTPLGIQHMLHRGGVDVSEREVVVVGRSDIVGKPLAMLLMARDSALGPSAANATVTVCHSRTQNLPEVTRRADILIAAIGRAKFITAEMVKPGAAVVDVGTNRTEEGLVGDVDFEAVKEVAGHISPVPGGVGPLTIAMLLKNTVKAAELHAA